MRLKDVLLNMLLVGLLVIVASQITRSKLITIYYQAVASFKVISDIIDNVRHGYWKTQSAKKVFQLRRSKALQSGGTGFALWYKGHKVFVSAGHVCDNALLGESYEAYLGNLSTNSRVMVYAISLRKDLCLVQLQDDITTDAFPLAEKDVPLNSTVITVGFPLLSEYTVRSGKYINIMTWDLPIDPSLAGTKQFQTECGIPKKTTVDLFVFKWDIQEDCLYNADAMLVKMFGDPGQSGSPVFNSTGEVIGVLVGGATKLPYTVVVRLSELKKFLGTNWEAIRLLNKSKNLKNQNHHTNKRAGGKKAQNSFPKKNFSFNIRKTFN